MTASSRTYGGDATIHSNQELDIETDRAGNVVAVWFRCQHLPFRQSKVGVERRQAMIRAYEEYPAPGLVAVEVLDA